MKNKVAIKKAVFLPAAIIFIIILAVGVIAPEQFLNIQTAIVNQVFSKLGWLFQVSALLFLGICLYLMFSKMGNVKIGGKDAKPILNYWNWFAISLTTGIGTGVLFFGIGEPVNHFMSPPEFLGIEAGSEEAAVFSLSQSYIHWGFIPYAMYCIIGVAIAYSIYNLKLPNSISSALFPAIGKKANSSAIGSTVDFICMVAIIIGVAGPLGAGLLQIGRGISIATGIPNNSVLWAGILVVTVATFIISSYTGLQRGIRKLSDINTKIFLGLLIVLFFMGPTAFILSLGTQATGELINNFFTRTLYMSPVNGSSWPIEWPIFYYATWIAFAPMIGKFLARISIGRTIRQFMLINLVLPSLFGMVWFTVFGGSAIYLQMNGTDIWGAMMQNGFEDASYALLSSFPLFSITTLIFVFTILISYVTMADSMTSTMADLSVSKGKDKDLGLIKIFWGLIMASLAAVNLIVPQGAVSTLDSIKMIAVVAGFPLLFLMLLVAFSVTRIVSMENKKSSVVNQEISEKNEAM